MKTVDTLVDDIYANKPIMAAIKLKDGTVVDAADLDELGYRLMQEEGVSFSEVGDRIRELDSEGVLLDMLKTLMENYQ